jgi:hypothetical protein
LLASERLPDWHFDNNVLRASTGSLGGKLWTSGGVCTKGFKRGPNLVDDSGTGGLFADSTESKRARDMPSICGLDRHR